MYLHIRTKLARSDRPVRGFSHFQQDSRTIQRPVPEGAAFEKLGRNPLLVSAASVN
jgi:hypothetical protein